MRKQVREAAKIQAILARLWDETVDPSNLRASFLVFREHALPYIQAGRVLSAREAQLYFDAALRASGFEPRVTGSPDRFNAGRTKASLSAAAKIDFLAFQANRGDDVAAAIRKAKLGMLRSAKRQVLNASRERLIELSQDDPNVLGWARVSDGSPCSFCMMLVSRGPVYDSVSVRFQAHDGCGCSVRAVPRNDPTRGWSGDAEAYRGLWEKYGSDAATFRFNIDTLRRTGELASHLAKAA